MIYANLDELKRYRGISDSLDTAIRFLVEHGIEGLKEGRNEVDGENVFINRFHYMTMPEEKAAFEAHEEYADIHLLLEGREYIGVTAMRNMEVTSVDRESDNIGCDGKVELWVPMEPGKVLIVFPEDAHMVKIQNGESVHVEKAVVKVLMHRCF